MLTCLECSGRFVGSSCLMSFRLWQVMTVHDGSTDLVFNFTGPRFCFVFLAVAVGGEISYIQFQLFFFLFYLSFYVSFFIAWIVSGRLLCLGRKRKKNCKLLCVPQPPASTLDVDKVSRSLKRPREIEQFPFVRPKRAAHQLTRWRVAALGSSSSSSGKRIVRRRFGVTSERQIIATLRFFLSYLFLSKPPSISTKARRKQNQSCWVIGFFVFLFRLTCFKSFDVTSNGHLNRV